MRIIAGKWGSRTIEAPPGRGTRPTTDRVRESWMSALHMDLPGSRVLDLFAGSGALGLEALSRGAEHATFVEKAGGALRALRSNIDRLGAVDDCTVVKADAVDYLEKTPENAFDMILADPPYGQEFAATLIRVFLRRPVAQWLWVEHRSDEPLPDAPGARTRRYGDTAITSVPAPE